MRVGLLLQARPARQPDEVDDRCGQRGQQHGGEHQIARRLVDHNRDRVAGRWR